jgi:siroheme synthase (precorrin-2 oxidase/ferrochelatase)
MDYLPITIKIVSANILIVGGGKVATHKAQILARFTDQATVVAPEITDELKALPFQTKEKAFGNKDHATVLHACKIVKDQVDVDKSFKAEIEEIEMSLRTR